jgi:opacity protein-like surface antigen
MKRFLVTLIALSFLQQANAQNIRIGVEGAYNSTWLFNKNVSDAGEELDYQKTFGSQIGVNAVFSLKEGLGLYAGVLSGKVNQKLKYRTNINLPNETSETEETKLSYIDIPVLLRITSSKGPYFEVGPQFSILSSSKLKTDLGTNDIDKGIKSSNISVEIGFGVDIKATDKLTVNAGLRFGYGLTDAAEKPSNAVGYEPTHAAVGGIHVGLSYSIL